MLTQPSQHSIPFFFKKGGAASSCSCSSSSVLARHTFRRNLHGQRGPGDGHHRPVKDLIESFQSQFGDLIRGFAATALARNELSAGEDPDRLAFELNGIMLAAGTNFVLHDDPAVLVLARQIVHQRLGTSLA